MTKLKKVAIALACCSSFLLADHHMGQHLPDLVMKDTKLSFKDIEGYQNYSIVASHYRTDMNEIRYILANPVAFEALKKGETMMPEGSKIVKIGWSTNPMETFPVALEAKDIQRVEYMIKDKTKHKESDGWGYARFVKKDGNYQAWGGDIQSCVSCHAAVKSTDALFTRFQKLF